MIDNSDTYSRKANRPPVSQARLTALEVGDLSRAARHRDGVFRIECPRGLRHASKARSVSKLVAAGLLEPNAHGDWYITPAGRAALQGDDHER